MTATPTSAVYGSPPLALADAPAGAAQVSPLVPGGAALEDFAEGSLGAVVMLAPPGTVERRHALGLALRALAPDGRLTVMAPKDKGGSRLAGELTALGAGFNESAKRHHRICVARRPADLAAAQDAIAAGAPRLDAKTGLWTQPGVFSWDRIDGGTAALVEALPSLAGAGADFGCGVGVLGKAVLASDKVTALSLIDLDRRAVAAARRNVDDGRARVFWADLRGPEPALEGLDFVVMNPPFHDGGAEDRALGQAFIRRAAGALRTGGALWMVANRHLPYEAPLAEAFKRVTPRGETGLYKIYEAVK